MKSNMIRLFYKTKNFKGTGKSHALRVYNKSKIAKYDNCKKNFNH